MIRFKKKNGLHYETLAAAIILVPLLGGCDLQLYEPVKTSSDDETLIVNTITGHVYLVRDQEVLELDRITIAQRAKARNSRVLPTEPFYYSGSRFDGTLSIKFVDRKLLYRLWLRYGPDDRATRNFFEYFIDDDWVNRGVVTVGFFDVDGFNVARKSIAISDMFHEVGDSEDTGAYYDEGQLKITFASFDRIASGSLNMTVR